MTAKMLKKQISDSTVEAVLNVIGFKNKKPFSDLTRDNKERLRLIVARNIIEWQKQGVPSVQFEELKKSDLIKKFNLKTLISLPIISNADDMSCHSEQNSQVTFTI